MRLRLVAFMLGVRTWRDCVEGGSGFTYLDRQLSEDYDTGVNLGQNLNEVARILRHPLQQHILD